MRRYRLIYFFMVLCALGFAMGLRDRLSSVTLIAALGIPVLSLVPFLFARFNISIALTPERLFLQKEEDGSIDISVRNAWWYPLTRVQITGDFVDESGLDIKRKHFVFELLPRHTEKLAIPVCFPYCGEYHTRLDSMDIYDVLGLFHFKIKLNLTCHAVVLPRYYSLLPFAPMSASHENDHSKRIDARSSYADLSHMREYMDGDLLKSVHWKLSAKQNELMVKVFDDDAAIHAALFCDMSPYSEEANLRHLATDGVLETALSIASRLISDSRGADIYWQGGQASEVDYANVKSQEELKLLQRRFAGVQALPSSRMPDEMFGRLSVESSMVNEVYVISPQLTMDFCASIAALRHAVSAPVHLLSIEPAPQEDAQTAAYLKSMDIDLWRIDPQRIAQSINAAIAANKSGDERD